MIRFPLVSVVNGGRSGRAFCLPAMKEPHQCEDRQKTTVKLDGSGRDGIGRIRLELNILCGKQTGVYGNRPGRRWHELGLTDAGWSVVIG